jgi:hypothetical protein
MEVYTSGHASGWVQNALPSPLTSFYFILMSGSVTGLAYFFGDKWYGAGDLWSTVAIAVMTALGLAAMGLRARKAKKAEQEQGEGFESALRGSSSGWDDAVSSPADIARLDELRSTFLKGIQTFQEYGKDIYSMPWYVIVGEPGSGKTEAIRRSELRFPDMLQDKLQGTGGTYSMHWWFTNQAIILDTAGAMLMQPEAAARFEEFLKLLRTYRAACPLNGMILTIPTDSLLSDAPHAAEQKARVIATQLAMIQKVLDVRFPIYLMVSKSDRLPGFREFFDMEGQSKFERQMMGWANPEPLGEAFSSESIYSAIDTISRRLQTRSLALLQNPEPLDRSPGSRRADEVDAAYNFPGVLRNLAPRLKLYLDVIFQTGAWAKKPPFFRGLFFTTALREGAQLDADLAKTLGLPLQQLPPGGIFAREKSAFLRDFFLEKIFPEKGLVTRLFDVGAHLRKRLTTFYGATIAILLLCLGFAWLVKDRIEEQLEDEQTMWASANATWQNGTFLRVIGRSASWSDQIPERPSWYVPSGTPAAGKSAAATDAPIEQLGEIHGRLDAKISLSWVFYPIPEWQDFLERRRQGYLTLFEGSVMKPVLDAARERILWDVAPGNTTNPDTQQRLASAYRRLVELEGWLDTRSKKTPSEAQWQAWFMDLLLYVTDSAPPGGLPPNAPTTARAAAAPAEKHQIDRLSKDLAYRAQQVYGPQVLLATRQWMSDPEGRAESALRQGADFIFGKTRAEAASNDAKGREAAERLQSALDYVERAEKNLLQMVETKPAGPRETVENEGLMPFQQALFEYQRISEQSSTGKKQSQLGMEVVSSTAAILAEVTEALPDVPEHLEYAAGLARQAKTGSTGPASGSADTEARWAAASKRYGAYKEAFSGLTSQAIGFTLGDAVGKLSEKLPDAAERIKTASSSTVPPPPADASKDKPANPQDAMRDHICEYLKKFRGTPLISEFFKNYDQELRTLLVQTLRFPLVQHSVSYASPFEFEDACKRLARIEKDAEALTQFSAPLYQCPERGPVEDIFKKLELVNAIKTALNNGLTIEIDAIEPPNTSQKQTETADPALSPAPVFGATLPKTSVMENIKDGWTKITVTIANIKKVDAAPNGDSKTLPYDKGFGSVSIVLTKTLPPPATPVTYSYDSSSGNWPLLREIASGGKNRFRIGNSGKIFVLRSSPSLPEGMWPDSKSFGTK